MNFSRVFAATALAVSFAFAQPGAPVVEQAGMQAPQKTSINSKMGFGIHGQFEIVSLYGLAQDWNLGDDEEAPAGIGFTGGFRGRIPMMPVVHFAPELNFHYAQLTQKDEAAERSFTQMDLEVPLMLRGILKDLFYVTAGAQLGFNLYSKATVDFGSDDNGGYLNPIDIEYEEDIDKASFGFSLVADSSSSTGYPSMPVLFWDLRIPIRMARAIMSRWTVESRNRSSSVSVSGLFNSDCRFSFILNNIV